MLTDGFVRRAKVVRVIDGDTFIADVDLGFRVWTTEQFRLLGVDCPERHGVTKEAGEAARLFAVQWFADVGNEVWIRSTKSEKFGRWLAEVHNGRGQSLYTALLTEGHAVAYDGGVRAAGAVSNPMFETGKT